MRKSVFFLSLLFILSGSWSIGQVENKSSLSIKQIMQKDFTGTAPSNIRWSKDGKRMYFRWKSESDKKTEQYVYSVKTGETVLADPEIMENDFPKRGVFNKKHSLQLISRDGDIILKDLKKDKERYVTRTLAFESNPHFNLDETQIVYTIENDIYTWNIETGETRQLTNFQTEKPEPNKRSEKEVRNAQDEWLYQDQIAMFKVFQEKSSRRNYGSYRGMRGAYGNFGGGRAAGPSPIYTEGKSLYNVELSPDAQYVTYTLFSRGADTRNTEMPKYVTRSGYTEIQDTRSKVGGSSYMTELGIYDIEKDSMYYFDVSKIPGIQDLPDYVTDYPEKYKDKKPVDREVRVTGPIWSEDGKYALVEASSNDNKDRWIMLLDLASGEPKLLDRQRDEAWIAGPGIGSYNMGWMPDNKRIWFQSEESGYSHLYVLNVETGEKMALTSGNFEVYGPRLSENKKYWYFHSNEVHPGEKHFYKMPVEGGERVQLTNMTGSNQVVLSPDEKSMAITYSFANRPPEVYYQEAKAGSEAIQLTDSRSEEFRAYNWRVPEFITFPANDGEDVYARLYQPEVKPKGGPAVIFVHGAGYLQNAHKWWSTYYHEYMFHNILVDNGYTVLDIDYRGSAGYGRDWRTGIYRHMGGKDLSDQVDGAAYLVSELGINPDRIGIYGGSYGGFITLMAMFNAPDVFACGAALRSVTDWAHYNHGYTANILNTPVEDSLAYRRSSPIYYADGLKGHLLMLHGMVDDNVHFQDIVRLSQRLIELGKENWELAVFPVEPHSFVRPDSWTDEYRRIFKLFQTHLK